MGFFEKKINKWLAWFLLGTTVVVVASNTKAGKKRWSKIADFLNHGLKELTHHIDKKEWGMETIKRWSDSDEKTNEK